MLLLSPGAPTGTGSDLGRLHETKDATGALERIVAWSLRVSSPEEAAEAVAAAFSAFATGRPRPVHIEIPLDVLEAPWSGPAPTATHRPTPAAPADALRAAADLLRGARNPLVVAGGGAVDAAGPLRAVAEALGAPVATTVNGKAVLDEAHPLSVGASVRLRALQSAAAESDAVLVVGSELGDSDLWEGAITGRTLVRRVRRNSASSRRGSSVIGPVCPRCERRRWVWQTQDEANDRDHAKGAQDRWHTSRSQEETRHEGRTDHELRSTGRPAGRRDRPACSRCR